MWMMIRGTVLGIAALGFGLFAAAGVFTVFIAVGMVPRFAEKTHTKSKLILYENMIVLGTVLGGAGSVVEKIYGIRLPIPVYVQLLLGILYWSMAGMFVGCMAITIAEMLNSIPILVRRGRIKNALSRAVWAIAMGKLAGSLFYYIFRIR